MTPASAIPAGADPRRERRARAAVRHEAPAGDREVRRLRRRRLLSRVAWAAVMVGALASVVWRQVEGGQRQRTVTALRDSLALAEGRRVHWSNEVQRQSARARVVRDAQARLGMHVARDEEIVLLPLPAPAAAGGAP